MENNIEFKGIIEEIWSYLTRNILTGIQKVIQVCIDGIYETSVRLFDYNFISALLSFIFSLGFALFVVGTLVSLISTTVDYSSGYKISFKQNILPIFFGLFSVYGFTYVPIILYKFTYYLQSLLMSSLYNVINKSDVPSSIFNYSKDVIVDRFFNIISTVSIVYLLVSMYCVIKIFIQSIKRGGVLLLIIGTGSLYMFSIPVSGTKVLTSYLKKIFALCFTSFFQTTLLSLGFAIFPHENIVGISLMLAASETSKIAEQFGLDVSAKDSFENAKRATMNIIKAGRMMAII